MHAEECYKGNFIGTDFDMDIDFTGKLPDDWRQFNKKYIPIYLEKHPGKSKVTAGLACGAIWTITKGILKGDIVLCPDGLGNYYIGEITDNYLYKPGGIFPHRRLLHWYPNTIKRSEMSKPLQNSAGAIGTVSNITKYSEEIENFIAGHRLSPIVSTDETIEDPTIFALETHLEDFLVHNWKQTELGKTYNIIEEEGELIGQQYQTDTGPIDILAVSKDKKEFLVVELKKGRASDAVVGQLQRYMGYVKEELAEKGQVIKGVIIALDDDIRIKRALAVANNIEFYRYQVSFKLFKG